MPPTADRRRPAILAGAAAAVALAALAGPPAARAGESGQPDADYPLTIDSAYPTDKGEVEADLGFRWEREHGGDDDLFEVRPGVRVGALEGLELSLELPHRSGEGDDAGQTDAELGAQYLLLDSKGAGLPALAVEGSFTLPAGSHAGREGEVGLLLTEPLTKGGQDGASLHLNASWLHLFDGGGSLDSREDRYAAAIGYSQPVAKDTTLVLDLVHEQDPDKGNQTNLVEAGVRQGIGDDLVLSLGAGAGLGGDSPGVLVTVGVQRSFKVF